MGINLKKLFSVRGAERALKGAIKWELRKRGITEDSSYEEIINALLDITDAIRNDIDSLDSRVSELEARDV